MKFRFERVNTDERRALECGGRVWVVVRLGKGRVKLGVVVVRLGKGRVKLGVVVVRLGKERVKLGIVVRRLGKGGFKVGVGLEIGVE